MEIKQLEQLLAESDFFKDLDPAYRQMLAGCGRNVVFRPGEYLFQEGEHAREFYLIRKGKVALQIKVPGRGPVILQTVQDGDVVGWAWLVPPYKRQYDACAIELTRAVAFDGVCIRSKCEQDPKLGYEFFKRFAAVMAARLSAMRLQLLDLYANP
ncbi:MAG: cyclic nucleotide-binding domain-containing protein [Verrucomicrobiae bacterium]|nr:cyclic nucleotide-binding domain-containing protein [Verrucomicrobiae bacterium]MCX7721879.1 cyclic nucleotide-binding domain-containing protein [Verrucomicrobiae bacterium]MDW7980300.1 cyclic nucleotide-binding domain-containing protein [Verrucomicrobiales bacterium]